jgi:hypothetical protein
MIDPPTSTLFINSAAEKCVPPSSSATTVVDLAMSGRPLFDLTQISQPASQQATSPRQSHETINSIIIVSRHQSAKQKKESRQTKWPQPKYPGTSRSRFFPFVNIVMLHMRILQLVPVSTNRRRLSRRLRFFSGCVELLAFCFLW